MDLKEGKGSMDRIITIGEREVKFRATARTPRLYRMLINRDMIIDMNSLGEAFRKAKEAKDNGEASGLTTENLMIFEDAAYVMARHANPEMEEKSPDEWLDTFDMFDIYDILPELLDLWNMNTATTAESKKK